MSDRERATTLSDAEFLYRTNPNYCEPEMIEDLTAIIRSLTEERDGLRAFKGSVERP